MLLNETQVRRYSRHILLPDVGGRGQQRLLAGAVHVQVGAGRVAELVALAYLAAAGVGTLVIGGDTDGSPDPEELRVGIVYGTGDARRSRYDAIRDRLEAVNPDVRVTTEATKGSLSLDPVNATDLAGALIAGGHAASRALAQLIGDNS